MKDEEVAFLNKLFFWYFLNIWVLSVDKEYPEEAHEDSLSKPRRKQDTEGVRYS